MGNQSRHMCVTRRCRVEQTILGTRADIFVEPTCVGWSRPSVESQIRHVWEPRADMYGILEQTINGELEQTSMVQTCAGIYGADICVEPACVGFHTWSKPSVGS